MGIAFCYVVRIVEHKLRIADLEKANLPDIPKLHGVFFPIA